MARGKKHSPEQVVNLLRQIEVSVANGNELGARPGIFVRECPQVIYIW